MTGNVQFNMDKDGHAVLNQEVVGTYKLDDFNVGNELNIDPIRIDNKGDVVRQSGQPVQTTETHPAAPSLHDLVESGELNPEGKDMISGVFGKTIMQLQMFLADENSSGMDDAISNACHDLVSQFGTQEAKRQITEMVSRLTAVTAKASALIAVMPAKLAMAGLADHQHFQKGGGGGGDDINIPSYGVQVQEVAAKNADYMNFGITIPIILTSVNHIINAIDWKKSVVDDVIRESLRAAISIAIFLMFYDHPVWMRGGAAAANELLGLFAMYGYKFGGPTRNPMVRYSATMVTQFLATWGLL